MNTSAPLFAEQNLEAETEKNIAELYSRMYALAAEDFTTTKDVADYIKVLTEWQRTLQQQLTTIIKAISTHTHNIPPHTHPIEPHFHISAQPGYPTSPNANALLTQPTPLVSELPVESSAMVWTDILSPNYMNTTLTEPNLSGNHVIVGPTAVGPLTMNERRAKTPKALLNPTVLPLAKDMV